MGAKQMGQGHARAWHWKATVQPHRHKQTLRDAVPNFQDGLYACAADACTCKQCTGLEARQCRKAHQRCSGCVGLEQHVVQRTLAQWDEVCKVVGCELITVLTHDG